MNVTSVYKTSDDSWLMDNPNMAFGCWASFKIKMTLYTRYFSWTNSADRPQSHRALRPLDLNYHPIEGEGTTSFVDFPVLDVRLWTCIFDLCTAAIPCTPSDLNV